MNKFYVAFEDRVEGPYTVEQLAQMKLLYDTPIRSDDMSSWKPAWQRPELLKQVAEKRQSTTAAGEPSKHGPPPRVSLMTTLVSGYGIVVSPIAWGLHTITAFDRPTELMSRDGLMLWSLVAASTGTMLSIFLGSMKIRRSPRTARWLLAAGFSLDILGWVAAMWLAAGSSSQKPGVADISEDVRSIITLACFLFEPVALIWVLFRRVGDAAKQPSRLA
jgi:hypothetical protein